MPLSINWLAFTFVAINSEVPRWYEIAYSLGWIVVVVNMRRWICYWSKQGCFPLHPAKYIINKPTKSEFRLWANACVCVTIHQLPKVRGFHWICYRQMNASYNSASKRSKFNIITCHSCMLRIDEYFRIICLPTHLTELCICVRIWTYGYSSYQSDENFLFD